MKFIFFTKEESFKKWYGISYDSDNKEDGKPILGTHKKRVIKFLFGYIQKSIALNLNSFLAYSKEDYELIKSISKTIEHEFIHECLDNLEVGFNQHHWATERLGLNGF